MGSTDSKCSELLEQMGWQSPSFAEEFFHPSLVSYLQVQNLEVILPKHAPQADLSIPDRKPAMYPRPNFCWEAYKMHLALIGPSTACKNQFLAFLPQLAAVIPGAPSKLAPGRNAVPYYFFDPDLHRMVVWELPEISWNQKNPEDYIRELGLLYMDCVFILFSEKYMLNDLYCKLVVHMAIHGIPFFVICTDSTAGMDQATMDKIKSYFQRRDIQGIRMLNPNNPGDVVKEIITEFFKEVSWNRSAIDKERTSDISDTILGQTVRLKELEKRADLNGRCGVCVGFDKDQGRYHIRLITNGVESDIALKQNNFSILKPKLLDAMVRIKDLTSKPELNGRYGFVDAFLRETERYRVLVPDSPGCGHALALKSANLDRVEETRGRPIQVVLPPAEPKRRAASAKPARPAHGPFVAESTGGQTWKVIGGESKGGIIVKKGKDFQSELENQRLSTSALVEELAIEEGRMHFRLLYGTGPKTGWVSLRVQDRDLLVKSDEVVCGSRVARAPPPRPAEPAGHDAPAKQKLDPEAFDPPAREKPTNGGYANGMESPSRQSSTPAASGAAAAPKPAGARADGGADDDLSDLLPKRAPAQEGGDDLMSRIRAAEDEQPEKVDTRAPRKAAAPREVPSAGMDIGEVLRAEAAETAAPSAGGRRSHSVRAGGARPAAEVEEEEPPLLPHRLTKEGVMGMKVWAVVGDPDEAEDIMDHLMDCGKTVFSVSPSDGHVPRVAELDTDPNLPKAEVLAYVDGTADPEEAIAAAPKLQLRGVLLHPSVDAFAAGLEGRLRAAGLEVFGADIPEELQPGEGLVIAPLD